MKFSPTVTAPILLIVVLIFTLIFGVIPVNSLAQDANPYLTMIIVQLVIFALPCLFYCAFKGKGYSSTLRLKVPSVSAILIMVISLGLMLCGSSVIEYFVSGYFPEEITNTSVATNAGFAMNSGWFDGVYLVITFALLPAITEEFLFRGIVLREYGTVGLFASVFFSSAAFAMCHLNLHRLPMYFFCGIVLSLLTYATRSLVASMVVHSVYNIFVLFFEDYIIYMAEKQNISALLFVIVMGGLSILFAVFFAFEASALYKNYAEDNLPSDYIPRKKKNSRQSTFTTLFSPAFISFAVVFVIITLIK